MYVDGRCPDYYFLYPYRYAPDARAVARWLHDAGLDPFPARARRRRRALSAMDCAMSRLL